MPSCTYSFRIAPPLYGLNGARVAVSDVAGFESVVVSVTLVDSVGTMGKAMGSVTLPGDGLGVMHNTRLDVTLPGTVAEWMTRRDEAGPILAAITNRVIDWYRYFSGHVLIRRIPVRSIRGYRLRDDEGREGWSLLGWPPGEASVTAGDEDPGLSGPLAEQLRSKGELPVWKGLYLDAAAEVLAGELRAAVLLANSAMETVINFAYRTVMPPDEVTKTFSGESSPPFRQLLKAINTAADTGISNSQLIKLADRVNRDRNNVSHGNPTSLSEEAVADAVQALFELQRIVEFSALVLLDERAGWDGKEPHE